MILGSNWFSADHCFAFNLIAKEKNIVAFCGSKGRTVH